MTHCSSWPWWYYTDISKHASGVDIRHLCQLGTPAKMIGQTNKQKSNFPLHHIRSSTWSTEVQQDLCSAVYTEEEGPRSLWLALRCCDRSSSGCHTIGNCMISHHCLALRTDPMTLCKSSTTADLCGGEVMAVNVWPRLNLPVKQNRYMHTGNFSVVLTVWCGAVRAGKSAAQSFSGDGWKWITIHCQIWSWETNRQQETVCVWVHMWMGDFPHT